MSKYGKQTTGAQLVAEHAAQLAGKTIVITGTSSGGLGAQTAIDLSRGSPEQIFLLARSLAKVQPVIDEIESLSPSTKTTFISVLLDDLDSVRSAAEEISRHASKIDILINNAGVMAKPYSVTKQGIESQFGTNHIGHFYLTLRLWPLIRVAGPQARIINVSSDGYKIGPFRDTDYNFSGGKDYDIWSGYGQSKTANILFSKGLAKRGVISFSLHPGVIFETSLSEGLDFETFKDVPEIAKRNTGAEFVMDEPKTLEQGVSCTVRAALDRDLEIENGGYLTDTNLVDVMEHAKDEKLIEHLWSVSEKIIGEKFEI